MWEGSRRLRGEAEVRVRELSVGVFLLKCTECLQSLLVFKLIIMTSGENLKLISLETKYNSAFLPALSCVNGGSVYAGRAKGQWKVRRLT